VNSHSLPFTLENNSPIEAILELDLRDYGEFQLVPRLADGVDTEIMVPIVEQADYKVNLDDPENVSDVNEGDLDEDDDELEQDRMNYVTIRLKPSSQLIFDLVYKPDQVEEEANFQIPIKMKGAGEVPGLIRNVSASCALSKLIIQGDPTKDDASREVPFGRTTITKGSKQLATHKDFQIRNPDFNQPAKWAVDTKLLDDQSVFKIIPSEGNIEPNAVQTVRATFNPIEAMDYKLKVPVFLNNDRTNPVTSIDLTGQGAQAKITFDRREIILPAMPLNITSKVTFTIFN